MTSTENSLDKAHWRHFFEQRLASVEVPPDGVRLRVGQGIHLLLARPDGLPLEVLLTPADDSPAYFKTSLTSMVYFGGDQLGSTETAWLEVIGEAIGQAEAESDWRQVLAIAMQRPGISSSGQRTNDQISSGSELIVRLLEPCNARCDFCACIGVMPDATAGFEQAVRVLRDGIEQGIRHVVFTGGEPTLLPNLPEYVSTAKALGYTRINMQTNGVRLADDTLVEQLAAAGLDGILLSLHSHEARVHDAVLKLEGGFEGAIEGIDNCLRHRIRVSLNFVIHTENMHQLEDYLLFVYRRFDRHTTASWHGHLGVTLSFVSPIGWTLEHKEIIPRITDVAPRLARALDVAEAIGMDVHVPGLCGIPLCTMPGYESFFDEFHGAGIPQLITRDWVPSCEGCQWRTSCSGYWKTYFELYGTDELGPDIVRPWARPPAPPPSPALVSAIARLVQKGLSDGHIAMQLNKRKVRTPRGGRWTDTNVTLLCREQGLAVEPRE